MRNKRTKIIFICLAAILLLPWPVAYAHDASDGVLEDKTIQMEVAEASALPTWSAFGRAIGGVTPGDLFYIDATNNQADFVVTLHITNPDELIHCYRYMILKVGTYVESNAGEWTEASSFDGQPIPDTLITLRNGQVSFILPGYAKYKVTIDGGCFNCNPTTNEGSASPQFYLTAE